MDHQVVSEIIHYKYLIRTGQMVVSEIGGPGHRRLLFAAFSSLDSPALLRVCAEGSEGEGQRRGHWFPAYSIGLQT